MKPGYLSTEFWLVVVAGVLTNLGTIDVPSKYKWIVDLGLVVGYALSRGLAKQAALPTFVDPPVDPTVPTGETRRAQQAPPVAAAPAEPTP